MENCIFCKIAKGEIDSAKIWEDDEFLAILDVNPNTKGMTLVLTKNHYDSYAFDMPDDIYQRLMLVSKKVAKILEKGLEVKRVTLVMEGMGVNHSHIKLYPLYGIGEKFEEIWTKEGNARPLRSKRLFFDKYQGYISTQLGPKADIGELKKLAEKIKRS